MKMKEQRRLEKNKPIYKHTCNCMMQDYQIIDELPETSSCVDSRYYKKDKNDKNNRWIDVTDQVKILKY